MAKAKHPPTLDYRLLITPRFNEREQRYVTLLLLETTQFFSAFAYELSVLEQRGKGTLQLTILGLKAPQLSLPRVGHAQFRKEYEDLHGVYEVTIKGLDEKTNTFSLRISEKQVELLKAPPKKFVDLFVEESRWLSQ